MNHREKHKNHRNEGSKTTCYPIAGPARILVALCLLLASTALASVGPVMNGADCLPAQENRLDGQTRSAIIDWICMKLDEIYVFPETAEKMEKHIRGKLEKGEYDTISDPRAFARQLRADLVAISHDKHFNVVYAPEPSIRRQRPDPEEEKKRKEQRIRQWKYDNFHFKKVERMDGNVGYLRFDGFASAYYGGDTAVAALQFLKHCDAVIIDLRYNGGGGADMIQLICSYFLEERTLINTWYERRRDRTDQSWSWAYVPGDKLLDADLFILTSRRTFSAAEEFTYDLKNLDRATLVGETTGGGGHMVTFERNDDLKIEFKIPFNRAINPISGDNWEARGIKPDVECPAEEALDKAYVLALEKIAEKSDPETNKKKWVAWLADYNKVKSAPIDVDAVVLQAYAGNYGPAKVFFEDGKLRVIQPGRTEKQILLAMAEDTFVIDGDPEFRIRFEKNDAGEVRSATVLFFDGSSDRVPRRK
jgi:hypothetical protein